MLKHLADELLIVNRRTPQRPADLRSEEASLANTAAKTPEAGTHVELAATLAASFADAWWWTAGSVVGIVHDARFGVRLRRDTTHWLHEGSLTIVAVV